ncbi:MAG: MmpS family transport accessory protein [Mycobacterium sp.]
MSRVTMTSQLPPNRRRIKRRTGPSILFAVLPAFAATVGVCGTTVGAANATPLYPQVTYQVTGDAPVAEYLSYQLDTGQQHQANVPLPWKTQFTAWQGQVYVLSAQAPGSITCTIEVDGKVVSKETATGQPARTACSR